MYGEGNTWVRGVFSLLKEKLSKFSLSKLNLTVYMNKTIS
jgi:hypothetical protein